ncbi:MAG: RidA family protein [Gemmatimonadaceae bacterium]|nr:RidA family protein [Gemmatimonadaceae bacterium]
MNTAGNDNAAGTDPSSGVQVLQPPGWAEPSGYANGVVASGRYVVLAGQIGWNPATSTFETDDFAEQVRQALANIVELLKEAGAEPSHLVRLTWYITDRAEYGAARRETGRAYRETLGRKFPPMSVVEVSGLIEERAKVEIEATAVIPSRQTG